MASVSLPRTFHARKSKLVIFVGVLPAVSLLLFGLGLAMDSGRMMIRAGGGLVLGLIFLGIWLVKRVKTVTVEPGAVSLDARRFPTAGARITKLEGPLGWSFWVALPDGSGGEVKRGFTDYVWPEVRELYEALKAAGIEGEMPYPR